MGLERRKTGLGRGAGSYLQGRRGLPASPTLHRQVAPGQVTAVQHPRVRAVAGAPNPRHVRTHVHGMRSAGSPRVGGAPAAEALGPRPAPAHLSELLMCAPHFTRSKVAGSSPGDQGFQTDEDREAQRERATCQGTPTEEGDAKI